MNNSKHHKPATAQQAAKVNCGNWAPLQVGPLHCRHKLWCKHWDTSTSGEMLWWVSLDLPPSPHHQGSVWGVGTAPRQEVRPACFSNYQLRLAFSKLQLIVTLITQSKDKPLRTMSHRLTHEGSSPAAHNSREDSTLTEPYRFQSNWSFHSNFA